MNSTKIANRTIFALCVVFTGAIAGAFVWLLLFIMDASISLVWNYLPNHFGTFFPLAVCLAGGLIIGLFAKRFGAYPETLGDVMRKVKETGRYEYSNIGLLSIAALLPLIFGGSVGPEAGLTGVIAGMCTWVGDRMKRFGLDFKQLTSVGTMTTLSAIFTAPLFGFVAPLYDDTHNDSDQTIHLPKAWKAALYFCAIAGALGAFAGLTTLFGGGMSMPHYTDISIGTKELACLVPLAIVGTAAGALYHLCDLGWEKAASLIGEKPIVKACIAGLALGLCGIALPFTLFSGEAQAEQLNEVWLSLGAPLLLATGVVKVVLTPLCVRFGWRGGHFFPAIFSGIAIGYAMSALTGADSIFCLCACTAALVGGVMCQPLMTVLLLLLCFPLKGVAITVGAAALGAAVCQTIIPDRAS